MVIGLELICCTCCGFYRVLNTVYIVRGSGFICQCIVTFLTDYDISRKSYTYIDYIHILQARSNPTPSKNKNKAPDPVKKVRNSKRNEINKPENSPKPAPHHQTTKRAYLHDQPREPNARHRGA